MVDAVRRDELGVRAPLGHPAVVEHEDLVDGVQAVQFVGDQQGGPAGRGRQQVRGQRAAGDLAGAEESFAAAWQLARGLSLPFQLALLERDDGRRLRA
jgi:hypothetical protein